jgi:hypothetical protein
VHLEFLSFLISSYKINKPHKLISNVPLIIRTYPMSLLDLISKRWPCPEVVSYYSLNYPSNIPCISRAYPMHIPCLSHAYPVPVPCCPMASRVYPMLSRGIPCLSRAIPCCPMSIPCYPVCVPWHPMLILWDFCGIN